MKTEHITIGQETWKKGTVKWLTDLIGEGFKIMRAYADGDNLKIYLNRRITSQHEMGSSPRYELVQEAYSVILGNLDNLRKINAPGENVGELSDEFMELERRCEQRHWEEQNGRK